MPPRPTPARALRTFVTCLAALACLWSAPFAARAAVAEWVGGSVGNWNTASGWSGGVVPNNTQSATYVATVAQALGQYAQVTMNLPNVELDQLNIRNTANVRVPAGSTLRLRNTGTSAAPVRALVGGGSLTLVGGRLDVGSGGATLTSANTIELVNNARIGGTGVFENLGTVVGNGLIGATPGSTDASLQILNAGTSASLVGSPRIVASGDGQTLTLAPTSINNTNAVRNVMGILEAINGATLTIRGNGADVFSTDFIPTTVFSRDGVIRAASGGRVRIVAGALLREPIFDAVPGSSFVVPAGETARFENIFLRSGLMRVDGAVRWDGGSNTGTFEVAGRVTGEFENNAGVIRLVPGAGAATLDYTNGTLVTTAASRIEGGGTFWGRTTAGSSLVNAGVVDANLSGETLGLFTNIAYDPGASFRATGGTLVIGRPEGTSTMQRRAGTAQDPTFVTDAAGKIVLSAAASMPGATVQNAGTFAANNTIRVKSISGPGAVEANGSLTAESIRAGALAVNFRAALVAGGATSRVGSLSVAATGRLDLNDDALVFDYASPETSPADAIRLAITTGKITAATGRTVGYAEASAIGSPATWNGESIDATTLLLLPTLAGDANLDRLVGFADLVALAQQYGATGGAAWTDGDSNYDGKVDFTDLVALAQNYNAPATMGIGDDGFAADWALAQALVPEPAALVACGVPLLLARRRVRCAIVCQARSASR